MTTIVLGIITYNRQHYLSNLLNSFLKTYNKNINYIIIIADDGSTDNTISYIEEFIKNNSNLTINFIKNQRKFIAGQTNSILKAAENYDYHCGFMVNDDIEFLKSGWDNNYLEAIMKTGYDHLVYFNKNYCSKKAKSFSHFSKKIRINDNLNIVSKINFMLCMGCFWTFTKKMIQKVGYFNTRDFYGSGYSHIEYTLRACRAGFNMASTLFDVDDNKIKVFCEENDKEYISVKDNKNINNNRLALIKTINNPKFIYFDDNIYNQ